MKKKFLCLFVSACILGSIAPVSADADRVNDGFSVSIQANEVYTKAPESNFPLEMQISLSEYTYEPGSVVQTSVNVEWPKENWNMTLNGNAYIYNKEDNTSVIIGEVSGYNGEVSMTNFVGINYTYHVENGNCIATATYNYDEFSNFDKMTFGTNTGEFDSAIVAYTEREVEMPYVGVTADPVSIAPASVDTSAIYLGEENLYNGVVEFAAWTRKEMGPDGINYVDATIKGSVSAAEPYIQEQEPTVWFIGLNQCNVSFAGNQYVKFFNNEMVPKSEHETVELRIPIPKSNKYVRVEITTSYTDTGLQNSDHTTYWELYDGGGLENIAQGDGLAFENKFMFSGSVPAGGSQSMRIQCNGKLGYFYSYVDETGHNNHTTWYPMAFFSGNVTCVN